MLNIAYYRLPTYLKECKALIVLALPMLLAQIAAVGTGFVDTVMAGGAGKEDLAAVALGSSLFATVFITLMGVMTALNPVLSQQYGEKHSHQIGEMGRQGLWLALGLGFFGLLVMWAMNGVFLRQFEMSAYTLDTMSKYIWYVGLSMPAAMIQRAFHAYALSLGKPNAITVISWLCFFLNIPLNYALVYGKWGMPALGGAGCGLATAIVLWVNALLLGGYVIKTPYFARFGLMDKFSLPDGKTLYRLLSLGTPIGLSFFIEVSLFTFIMFLVAKLPTNTENYVAAQQIVISLTSLIYMIPQSIGIAATTRISYSLGRQKPARARYVGAVSISLSLIMALMTALLLVFGKYPIARLYTNDTTVIGIATSLMMFAAAFQLMDAAQCVASYALRGYQITRLPMLIHVVAFWGFGLLPGYYLAFHRQMGIYGFWWSLVLSLSVAAVFLLWYLEHYSKRLICQN